MPKAAARRATGSERFNTLATSNAAVSEPLLLEGHRQAYAAMKAERLLGLQIPGQLGGEGAGLVQIAELCSTLGQACSAAAMTFAMHHIPEAERDAAIAEMWRVLRPGGSLLLADLANVGLHGLLTRLLSRHMDPESIDIRRYRDILTDNGFQQVGTALIRPATRILTAAKPA